MCVCVCVCVCVCGQDHCESLEGGTVYEEKYVLTLVGGDWY